MLQGREGKTGTLPESCPALGRPSGILLEDFSDLLEVMGPPPLFILQSKSCFLKSLGKLGLVDSGISPASEEPAAGVDRSCPFVTLHLWSDGVLPRPTQHAQCLLVSPSLYSPLPPPSVNFTSSWFLSNLP